MTEACPLPSPGEYRYGEIQSKVEETMMRKVFAALREATEQARREMAAAGLEMKPPSKDYFTSVVFQQVFCVLCKADPDTFLGGEPEIAKAVIRNMHDIARHYWKADV